MAATKVGTVAVALQNLGLLYNLGRAVARSKNPGGLVVLSGDDVAPLVEIGLTDLPKTGGLKPSSPPPLRQACTQFSLHYHEYEKLLNDKIIVLTYIFLMYVEGSIKAASPFQRIII